MGRRQLADFYSIKEVAGALGVCPHTVRRMIKGGRLKAHRIGGRYRISDEDYRHYVASRRG